MPLAGPNKQLFEASLLRMYDLFLSGTQESPTREEVIKTISEIIQDTPDLWQSDDDMGNTDDITTHTSSDRARRACKHLEDCGWFAVNKSGYRTQVEFSPGTIPLIQSLSKINDGSVMRLEGVMSTLNAILGKLDSGQDGYASALEQCSVHLHEVYTHMKGTRTKLLSLRSDTFKLRTYQARFDYLLSRYMEDIHKHDITHLMSDRHPYLLKKKTLRVIDNIVGEDGRMAKLGHEIALSEFSSKMENGTDIERYDAEEKGMSIAEHLFSKIKDTLDLIEDVAKSIMDIKRKIDVQLATQGSMRSVFSRGDNDHLSEVINIFAKSMSKRNSYSNTDGVPDLLISRCDYIGEFNLREPNSIAKPKSSKLSDELPDPIGDFRKELTDEYLHRISPDEFKLENFLDKILNINDQVEINNEVIKSVDDFIMVSTLIKIIVSGDCPSNLHKKFNFQHENEWDMVQTEWANMPRVKVRRVKEISYAA